MVIQELMCRKMTWREGVDLIGVKSRSIWYRILDDIEIADWKVKRYYKPGSLQAHYYIDLNDPWKGRSLEDTSY